MSSIYRAVAKATQTPIYSDRVFDGASENWRNVFKVVT